MRKLLISGALVGLFAVPASASPLIPVSAPFTAENEHVIQVKKKGHRAYGWSQGRKVGWRGRGMPPGQYKKLRRW